MNPFIINASVGHLSSLRKLGFKTFSDYWSEEYDYQEGVERIKSIQKICDDLSTLPQEEIQAMYQNMLPLLRDNRDCYKNLTNEYIQKSMTKKRIKMF